MIRTRTPIDSSTGRSGFTLIEILIVLAIIALLAAILFPVFAKVRERGRTTACASNMRQIGTAFAMYTADHDGWMPLITYTSQVCAWPDRLLPYIKSNQIFWCPSFPRGEYQPGCPTSACDAQGCTNYHGSYQSNPLIHSSGTQPETICTHPATTIYSVDGLGGDFTMYGNTVTSIQDMETGGVRFRHSDGANALFVDGHVKWMAAGAMLDVHLWDAMAAVP